MLASATPPGREPIFYRYNGLGRFLEQRNTALPAGARKILTHWDGLAHRLLIEHGDGGVGYVPVRRFVHGPGVDEPRVEYRRQPDGSHARLWLAADRQGSVAAASNDAGAAVPVTHGPFGEPGGAPGPRLRYTGQWLDPDTQLYHYRARWYSPWLGRFMQPDPIEDGDGPNLYAYVGNDPVNWSDPTGEIGVIGGLIGGGIELGAQILSGDARSYRAAASQILTGQRCTACRDAGRNLAKVGISAAGGAAGAGFLGVATKGLNFGQKAFVPANFGAKVGVITTGLKGAVDRRLTGTDLAVGAGVGAVTGGLGSFAPTAAGQAAARATGFRGARGPTEFSTDASLNALGEVAQGTLTAASGASKPTKRR